MNTFEAIKLLMEQDIRADFGEIHNHESVAEHLAERIDTLWNENEKLKARNEQLEVALRDVYEVYAGSEGIPQPMTAAEGYLLRLVKEMANTASAALGEKKDDNE